MVWRGGRWRVTSAHHEVEISVPGEVGHVVGYTWGNVREEDDRRRPTIVDCGDGEPDDVEDESPVPESCHSEDVGDARGVSSVLR